MTETTPTPTTMTMTDPTTTATDTTTTGVDTTETDDTTTGDPCGNGEIDDGEDCDGDALGDATCMDQGFAAGELSCNDDCTFNTDACNDCGNDAVDDGEDCDGKDLGGQDCLGQGFDGGDLGCADDCTFDESMCFDIACGDGMINAPEVCDGMDLAGEDCVSQMFDGGTLACDAMNCRSFDTTGCYVCGDDAIGGPEVCDGADLAMEDCVSQMFDGGTLGCAMDCTGYDTSGCYVCGDDAIGGPEICDGADLAGEDCVSQGFDGGTLGCAVDCTGYDTSGCFICGDGVADPGEDCDGADLGGASCASTGFTGGGAIDCAPDCTYDTTMCVGPVVVCSTPGVAIGPDFGTVTTDTIVTPAPNGFISDVNVDVDANHTWVGDLELDIRQVETDTSVLLIENPCGNQDDINAIFDQDLGIPPACAGIPAISGDVLPDPGNLDNFTGIPDGQATWELTFLDEANGDGGTLNEWCVIIDSAPVDPVTCGDGIIMFGEECEGADLAGEDCVSRGFPSGGTLGCDPVTCQFDFGMCDATAGQCGNTVVENDGIDSFEDCDTNEGISGTRCEDLGFTGGSLDCGFPVCGFDTSDCSNDVIAACSAAMLGITITNGAPAEDTINLMDMGNVSDIDVFIDADHVWVGDMDITLTNDTTGTSIDLFSDQCTSEDDMWAFFNDEGNGLTDCLIPVAAEGNLTPEEPLSTFDGEAIAGDWRLTIEDDVGVDDGVFNQWCIYITP